MKRYKLKELFTLLSYEDQRTLVLADLNWMCQQAWNGIQDGTFPVAPDQIAKLTKVDPQTMANLDRAVESRDADGSLKIGISELVRSLPLTQKESIGPKINIYFKRHLPSHIFEAVYDAAGLDIKQLPYDLNFPTEIDEKPS